MYKKVYVSQIKDAPIGHDKKCCQILMPKSGAHFHTSLHCWQIYVKLCVCWLWRGGFFLQRQGAAKAACYHNSWQLYSYLQFLRGQQFVTICDYSLPVFSMPMRRTLGYYNLLFKLLTFLKWYVVGFVTNFVGFMINIAIHVGNVDDESPH